MADDTKFYQTKEFKKTKMKWYQKLKKSGFEDIEWHDIKTGDGENSSYLKSHFVQAYLGDKLTNKNTLGNSSKYEAQRAIDHFNSHGVFENEIDKRLWQLYSDGATYREMSQALRKESRSKTSYSVFWVFHRIKHLRCEMIKFNNVDENGLKFQDEGKDTLMDYEQFDFEINGEEDE